MRSRVPVYNAVYYAIIVVLKSVRRRGEIRYHTRNNHRFGPRVKRTARQIRRVPTTYALDNTVLLFCVGHGNAAVRFENMHNSITFSSDR